MKAAPKMCEMCRHKTVVFEFGPVQIGFEMCRSVVSRLYSKSAKSFQSCRSQKLLQNIDENKPSIVKIGFDKAENRTSKLWEPHFSPQTPYSLSPPGSHTQPRPWRLREAAPTRLCARQLRERLIWRDTIHAHRLLSTGGERANFTELVLGCIEVGVCKYILI